MKINEGTNWIVKFVRVFNGGNAVQFYAAKIGTFHGNTRTIRCCYCYCAAVATFEQFNTPFINCDSYLSIHFLIPFVGIVLHFTAFIQICFGYAVRAPKIIIKSSIQIMLIQYFTCLHIKCHQIPNGTFYACPWYASISWKGVQTSVEETSFAWVVYCCCNFVLFFFISFLKNDFFAIMNGNGKCFDIKKFMLIFIERFLFRIKNGQFFFFMFWMHST